MTGGEHGIKMIRGNDHIQFDIVVKMAKGALHCGYYARDKEKMANVGVEEQTQVHINVS